MNRKYLSGIALAALLFVGSGAAAAEKKAAPTAVKTEAPKAEKAAESKAEAKATPEAKASPSAEPTKAVEAKEEAKAEEKAKPAVHHKSRGIATTLAWVPGIALHGVGHMYAGSWMKGVGLLGIEGIAVGMGAVYAQDIIKDIDKIQNNNGTSIPDTGFAVTRIGVLLVATSAFFFTWFDDISGASTAVDVYNKKADQEAQEAYYQLAPTQNGAMLVYTKNF